MDFDALKFIYEIERRPAIWNMKCNEYSNRGKKIKQWEEIVDLYSEPHASEDSKMKLGLNLQKKWRNMRDSFMRECRRIASSKRRPGGAHKHKYKYYKQLLFLKPFAINYETKHERNGETYEEPVSMTYSEEPVTRPHCDDHNAPPRKKSKKHFSTEKVHRDLVSAFKSTRQENSTEEDPDRHFMLSLLDDFKLVPGRLKPMVKINIMKCIMEAHDDSYGYSHAQHQDNQSVQIYLNSPSGSTRNYQTNQSLIIRSPVSNPIEESSSSASSDTPLSAQCEVLIKTE